MIKLQHYMQVTPLFQTIGKHYGFSPRLLLVMCSDHSKPPPVVVEHFQKSSLSSMMHRQQDDIEMAPSPIMGGSDVESEPESELNLNYYHLVNEVWHFCSVDWGSRCKTFKGVRWQ